MSTRDIYIAKMKLQLDQMNASMHELEVKALLAKEEAREKYKLELLKLREQSAQANSKLDEIQAASVDSWEALVAHTEKVRDAFVSSYHHFKSQF